MIYKKPIPGWLKRLVKTQFDKECHDRGHDRDNNKKRGMNYCKDCMGEAVCDSCNELESSCYKQGHKTVRILKAARELGIRVTAITELWDISKISTYRINGRTIVHLTSRKKASLHKSKARPAFNKCRICEYELNSAFDHYCSIACKMEGESKNGQIGVLGQELFEGANDDINGDFLDQELLEGADQERAVLESEGANGDQESLENANRDNYDLPANMQNNCPPRSFRKRSRKCAPERSPLF